MFKILSLKNLMHNITVKPSSYFFKIGIPELCYLSKMHCGTSGLARIEINQPDPDPWELFREWYGEAKKFVFSELMNLATAEKDGTVSNRTVVMREIQENGVIFCCPDKGRKCIQIEKNPSVAVCFLWSYTNEDKRVVKQVRMEGVAEKLPFEEVAQQFEGEPLYCKIRAHICKQGDPVNWDRLKRKHDDVLKEVLETGCKLETPKDYTGYKIIPILMDFYYAHDNHIADRMLFKKENNLWKHQRICA